VVGYALTLDRIDVDGCVLGEQDPTFTDEHIAGINRAVSKPTFRLTQGIEYDSSVT
jgi:hypothetical protein